jgi:hypothetical protein
VLSNEGNVADAVLYLTECVADLDSISRSDYSEGDEIHHKLVEHYLREFLKAFQIGLKVAVPKLGLFVRPAPVRYAGVAGNSYHQIACRMALQQYKAIWRRTDPHGYVVSLSPRQSEFDISVNEITDKDAIRGWPLYRDDLAALFSEPIDGQFLRAGIETETNSSDGPWSEPTTPSQWAKVFGLSWDALRRRFNDGSIRNKKLSTKSYRVHVDDLPPGHKSA